MVSVRELVSFSIRNHVWFLSVWIITQFCVGQFTEKFVDILGLPMRRIIELHKLSGQILVLFAIVLVIERSYMISSQIPRPPIKHDLINTSIRNHYIFFIILLPAQYLTTVMAGDVAKSLGLSESTVFKAHGWIGLLLVINAVVLVVEKFLLPMYTKGSKEPKDK